MNKIILLYVLVFAVLPCVANAETIYLKDGRVLSGEVLERGDYYVTVNVNGVPQKIFTAQLDRIEKDSTQSQFLLNLDPAKFSDISANKLRLIQRFLEVNGTKENLETNIRRILSNAPDEKKEEFKKLFDLTGIITEIVPVYDKYYTDTDLQLLIQFYESPTGQKFLKVTPQVMKEALDKSIEYFERNVPSQK